jgi:2-polyprenyl-3-methyl-5-hydroxy-6-metoxy-1,4-benzoquinol methylase
MNFDQFAKQYKDLQNRNIKLSGEDWDYFLKNKAEFVRRQAGEGFKGRTLDYGCGIGALSQELQAALPESTIDGYDISAESVKLVPSDVSSRGLFTHNLEEISTVYDLVVVSGVFHHVVPEKRKGIALEITSRLKSGGKAVVFEHNPINPLTRLVVSQCEFDEDAILVYPADLTRILAGEGLENISRDYLVFFPKIISWLRPLEPGLRWCPMGATYALVGGKK